MIMTTLNAQPIGTTQAMDLLKRYQRLHDGLSDMVESGRLTEADIPDDYDWLVNSMLVPLANDQGQELLDQSAGDVNASSIHDSSSPMPGDRSVQAELSMVEFDVVLAALRLYQLTPGQQMPASIAEIATEHSSTLPHAEDIEELCQRLNMSPSKPAPAA
jgi:hypothetical protein